MKNTFVIRNDKDYKKSTAHMEILIEIVMDKEEENTPREVLDEIRIYGLL